MKVLKNRDFLLLWAGQAISNTGDWLIMVALVLLVSDLSGSALAVGTLMIFKILPAVLFGSVAGVMVDRFDRKRTMIVCDVARGLLVAALPFVRSIYEVYLITFLMDSLSLLFQPAKDASVPNLVGPGEILVANSLSYTTTQLTMMMGIGFGSTIILVVHAVMRAVPQAVFDTMSHIPVVHYFVPKLAGSQAVFVVDALSFFLSAILIGLIRMPKLEVRRAAVRFGQFKDDLMEGVRFIAGHREVRTMMIAIGMAILGGGTIYTLGVFYSQQVLGVGKTGFGFLLTVLAAGMLVGGASAGVVGRLFTRQKLFTTSILIFGVGLIVFALVPIYEVSMLTSGIGGVVLALVFVSGYTFLQETVENELRGRIFAALESLLRVSLLVSVAVAGLVADLIGQRTVQLAGLTWHVNGAQTTLFLGGVVVVGAGVLALMEVGMPSLNGGPGEAHGT